MKVQFSRKALQFYRWHPSPDGGHAEVDDNATVHALLVGHLHAWKRYRTSEFRFMSSPHYLRRYDSVPAVCGRTVRVVYPMAFDTTSDESLCRVCVSMLEARSMMGETEFWKQVDDAEHREYRLEVERERRRERKHSQGDKPAAAAAADPLQQLMSEADDEPADSPDYDHMLKGLLDQDTRQQEANDPERDADQA